MRKLIKHSNFLSLMVLILAVMSCEDGEIQLEKNTPLGNPELSITGIFPERGLKLDTLTIFGTGFDPVAYQNRVVFSSNVQQTFYVAETGLVTDSVIFIIERSNTLAKVVDATPTQMKIIVPNIGTNDPTNRLVSGPVSVIFGIDTVDSDVFFTLISNRTRPVINDYIPKFGAPGEPVVIEVFNLAPNNSDKIDSTVVRFGQTIVKLDTANGAEIRLRVPSVFPGPTDLIVGAVTPTLDTLWSSPVNFGILPSPIAPFTVATYFTQDQTFLEGIVGFGETVTNDEGSFVRLDDYSLENTNLTFSKGVAVDTVNKRFYWVDISSVTGASIPRILKGDLESGQGDVSFFNTQTDATIAEDVDLLLKDNFLYLGGPNIRRYALDNNGDLIAGDNIIWDGNGDNSITNVKADGNTFYWVDNLNATIYKGNLTGSTLTGVQELYTASDGLNSPRAVAIDNFRNILFISDIVGDNSVIMRGNLDGSANLTDFFENEDPVNTGSINDLEIDLNEEFVYYNLRTGIFRKKLSGNTNPELVYSFPISAFFDF